MRKALIGFIALFLLNAKSTDFVTWVAIGDSITYMNEHPAESNFNVSKGYMKLIQEKYPHVSYINRGYNGWTAKKMASEIEKLKIEKADVYTFFMGTNDWTNSVSVGTINDYPLVNQTFYSALGQIIRHLKGLNPAAKIILFTPMQRSDFVYFKNFKNNHHGSYKAKNGQNLSDFADAILNVAKNQNLQVVDLYYKSGMELSRMAKFKYLRSGADSTYVRVPYPDYINMPFNPEKDLYPYPKEAADLTYDGLHPNDEGYKIIAQMLEKVFF
jgi:lysophospholipase L1-like esterase